MYDTVAFSVARLTSALSTPGGLAQRLLHPAHAARAGHADDRQRLLRGHDAVAGSLDGGDEVAGRDLAGVERHRRLLGRQVHGGLVDALDLADGLLRARDAARAGHAGDRQLDGGVAVAHGAPVAVRFAGPATLPRILFPRSRTMVPRGHCSCRDPGPDAGSGPAGGAPAARPGMIAGGTGSDEARDHGHLGPAARDHRPRAARGAAARAPPRDARPRLRARAVLPRAARRAPASSPATSRAWTTSPACRSPRRRTSATTTPTACSPCP